MKKCLLLLLLCSLCFSITAQEAQEEDKNQQLTDSLKALFIQYNALRQEVSATNSILNNITDKDLTDARARYNKSVESIKSTTYFVEAMNKSLSALEASLSATEYFSGISALNNPTNDELGFKLEDEILILLDKNIIAKAKKMKTASKFKRIVSNIINNPITNFVVSSVPAVSSISSVINLTNSVAVTEGNIEPEDLERFQKELKKYINHYEALAKANNTLNDNISNLDIKADALKKLLQDFIITTSVYLYKMDRSQMSDLSHNELIAQHYNYVKVQDHIATIERKYQKGGRLSYAGLIRDGRLSYSVVGRQKIDFMAEQLEQLVNEYLTALDQFHQNITTTLEKARELSKDKNKIDDKIKTLDKQYEEVRSTFLNNVDLKTMKRRLDAIPRY
ncbi:MAG: hypothetical protein AAF734_04855 [Bacteroidota bacterium]